MSRAGRRHHRERVIANRVQQYMDVIGGTGYERIDDLYLRPSGTAAERSLLSCGRARCGCCHPSKRWHRKERRQAAKRLIEEQT